MVQRWLLIILFATQALVPIGAELCPCDVPATVAAQECSCGCDMGDEEEPCCYEAPAQPVKQASATLSQLQQKAPHFPVPGQTVPGETCVAYAPVASESIITPRDFLLCLTRAERAPPA